MRMSSLLTRTLRDQPSEAGTRSHELLLRGGFVRRVAAGVYTFMPLGRQVLRRVEAIIREEMDATGAQELLMPVLQPIELWRQSGRVALLADAYSAFVVEGRGGHFVLGPTHEEVVTAIAATDIESYRDLPATVYQIQTKFRDEARPRFGLLRGREFLMCDAYSFDAGPAEMQATYDRVFAAYRRVFERCGLDCTPVEAVSGAIGGEVNHEFMVPSAIGEDFFARCRCGYAADLEAAAVAPPAPTAEAPPDEPLTTHHTPDRPGIDAVVDFFAAHGLTADGMLKCVAVTDPDGEPGVVLVPGDREARMPTGWRPFDDDDFASFPALVRGYIGPMGLQDQGVHVFADNGVGASRTWVTGANRRDHHVTGATLGRDFAVDTWGPFIVAKDGDRCPRCDDGILSIARAVEAGHTFQLGTRYSSTIDGARFVAAGGDERPFFMGCYGIGVSRLVAVIAERYHDDAGLTWPESVAPYDVHLAAIGGDRSPEVVAAAEEIYARLTAAGTAVLYDDREASAGVKFADADLIGCPTQLIVGTRGLARDVIERKVRATGERTEVPATAVI